MRIIPQRSQSRKTSGQTPEESISALHSWMQKNEQMITSISGRLAVVETRLSLVAPLSNPESRGEVLGPIQRLVVEGRKNHMMNARAWARVLDHDLAVLQTTTQGYGQQLDTLTGQLASLKASVEETATADQGLKADAAQLTASVMDRLAKMEQKQGRPLVMRLGRFELPLEISGILMGGLAFMVAALVFLGQKAVLGDPLFLAGIGCVFLVSAVVKHVTRAGKMRPAAHPGPVACAPVSGCEEKA